jgi:hypothetical protein
VYTRGRLLGGLNQLISSPGLRIRKGWADYTYLRGQIFQAEYDGFAGQTDDPERPQKGGGARDGLYEARRMRDVQQEPHAACASSFAAHVGQMPCDAPALAGLVLSKSGHQAQMMTSGAAGVRFVFAMS